MKKSRFNEAQIIGVLREQEAGSPTAEVCRRHGISEQTFYRWKAKYSGMSVSDAQKLKTLEDENRRLKTLLAESMLDVSALKDLLGKMYGPPRPCKVRGRSDENSLPKCIRPLASGLLLQPGHDEIRACRSQLTASCRSTLFCPGLTARRVAEPGDAEVRERLRGPAAERRRFGYRRLGILLEREGVSMNKKKLFRLYREEGLAVRRRRGRKRATGTRAPMALPDGPNQC